MRRNLIYNEDDNTDQWGMLYLVDGVREVAHIMENTKIKKKKKIPI